MQQRLAIEQIVPDAASQDEEFDAEELARLAQSIAPEDVQLYYQIALAGRRDLAMAPAPRLGFEMTLLRMLAFRPEIEAVPRQPRAAPLNVAVPPASTAPAAGAPATIDADNWLGLIDAAQLTGMVRQFALNCVPASFADGLLSLRLDAAAADRRTRQIEEKLLLALVKFLGREIRLSIEVAGPVLATPARQRAFAEQDRASIAAAAFEDDPAVRGLRERFGAEVDAASIKPGN